MDLGQLEALVEVAAHRSFSRAAEALGLTQPSVTARIQGLERDLGETLFERNGRGVRLTEMGTTFLPHARRALKAPNIRAPSPGRSRHGSHTRRPAPRSVG